MKSHFFKKLGAAFLAAVMVAVSVPVFAASDTIEVIFTDVTSTDPTTLSGEAKVMVSVKGAAGEATIAQIPLEFDGDLKYKSIQFLKGENNPPSCFLYSPNAALANNQKRLMPSIIATDPITFDEKTDLFILTFAGEAGKSVKLSLNDLDNAYCTVGGEDLMAAKKKNETFKSSESDNEGITATVKLVMDGIAGFTAGSNTQDGYSSSGVEIKITSENTEGYTIYTVLNNTLVSKGGHRENTSVASFTVENTVIANDTYTVEVSGIGYVTYKAEGVTFENALEITNADFIPGDIDADGDVDGYDKKAWYEALAAYEADSDDYNEAADFDRSGVIDMYDISKDGSNDIVYAGLEIPEDGSGDNGSSDNSGSTGDNAADKATAPAKMSAPKLDGGDEELEVEWTKPADGGSAITGYVIKYGTSSDSLNKTVEIKDASKTKTTIEDLDEDERYYVSIAAVNAIGTGEFSDTANAKTDSGSSSDSGSGGGGGGGGGSVGGAVSTPVTTPGTTTGTTDAASGLFTDLGGYEWAQEAIYALKNAGIISGTSATTYSPSLNIKRGDFILILTRMLKLDDVAASDNFADVPAGSYYYDAIAKAKAAGIAKGDNNMFRPEDSITRQDLITLAYRAFQAKGYIAEATDLSNLDSFNDKASISDYAAAPMAAMVGAGIIQGSGGGVNPLGNATRAEVAVMCNRLVALIK